MPLKRMVCRQARWSPFWGLAVQSPPSIGGLQPSGSSCQQVGSHIRRTPQQEAVQAAVESVHALQRMQCAALASNPHVKACQLIA